jgi:purine-nucleoside phosphorylase
LLNNTIENKPYNNYRDAGNTYLRTIGSKVEQSLDYIKSRISTFNPETGIILGTGLGGLARDVEIKYKLDYGDIPYFPVSTVESHHGNLIFGRISNHNAVVMQGRFHYYEGYNLHEVTYPLRIMQRLGVHTLLVSNACGAVNPIFSRGDLMVMRDHINFLFDTPLKGFKMNFMNKVIYDRELIKLAEDVALENHIPVRKGVYCSFRGPSLETRSEYRMARKLGADVVGMSTIPEALLSKHHDIRVLGFSIVTDLGFPDSLVPAKIEEILETAAEAEPKLTLLMKKIIERL